VADPTGTFAGENAFGGEGGFTGEVVFAGETGLAGASDSGLVVVMDVTGGCLRVAGGEPTSGRR
jgi:hypothetical protein